VEVHSLRLARCHQLAVLERLDAPLLFWSTMPFASLMIVRLHTLFLDTNRTRLVRKPHPAESFFNFFTPPTPPNKDEDENDDDDDQVRPVAMLLVEHC